MSLAPPPGSSSPLMALNLQQGVGAPPKSRYATHVLLCHFCCSSQHTLAPALPAVASHVSTQVEVHKCAAATCTSTARVGCACVCTYITCRHTRLSAYLLTSSGLGRSYMMGTTRAPAACTQTTQCVETGGSSCCVRHCVDCGVLAAHAHTDPPACQWRPAAA